MTGCWIETIVLDITDRFTLFVCVEQNAGCADRQEFSLLVQAVFDSAVSLSSVWVLAFPTPIDSSLKSLVYFHQILCFFNSRVKPFESCTSCSMHFVNFATAFAGGLGCKGIPFYCFFFCNG